MAKISITLPNITEISMEADDPSDLREMVVIVKSDLLHELVRLPQAGTQNEDVLRGPDKDISVPAHGSGKTSDTHPISDGTDRNGVAAPEGSPKEIPEESLEVAPPPEQAPSSETTPPAGSTRRSSPNPSISSNPSNPSIPAELSDPRLGHDFAVFCRTVNPIGDMRKVVAAAEGAARNFSMANVDAWELGHLFGIAGWTQPHSFTQALRNAARSKFRWMERVPGRAGRYSVTDEGRAVVLKGTSLL